MLCITANDQTDSNKFDSEHKDIDSNFAKPEERSKNLQFNANFILNIIN